MYFQILLVLTCVCGCTRMEMNLGEIKTELQNNILKFGYGINYKYVGMMSHSFDRFYVVRKFELPKVQYLKFDIIPYDKGCHHLEEAKTKGGYNIGMIDEIKQYYIKIALHIDYYRKQIEYYNQTASDILTNEIALIPSTFTKNDRQKRGIIASLITGFIGLAYEEILFSCIMKGKVLCKRQFMSWKIR